MADLESIIRSQDSETKDSDIDSSNLEMQEKFLRNQRFQSDTLDRKWLAEWATAAVSLWLFFVLLIVINKARLELSDAVLMTLLGTTTLNVLGLTYIVLKGHFSATYEK